MESSLRYRTICNLAAMHTRRKAIVAAFLQYYSSLLSECTTISLADHVTA